MEKFLKYDESWIIAAPSPHINGFIPYTICDVTVQLSAKVLTQRRTNTKLTEVLGDVGGLMEVIYSFFNIIAVFITDILYEKSLIKNLFSFDLEKKIKNEEKKNKKLINEKNYMIVDDDDVDFCSENIEKTCDYKKKKNKLNFVKYFEEDKGYDEDLEDRKKCSGFNSVNINYSHPKLCIDNYDNYIKTKIIANVIQSEKAFNKYFNIKTIPNK